jgi:hypothetical protein
MIFMDATILLYYETGTNDEMVNSCSTRIYKGDSAKYPNARMPECPIRRKWTLKYIIYINIYNIFYINLLI